MSSSQQRLPRIRPARLAAPGGEAACSVSRTCVFATGLLLAFLGGSLSADDEWVHVESLQGRFQADFPAQPEESTQQIESDAGRVPHTTLLTELEGGQVAFGIVYSDYPPATIEARGQRMLEDVRSSAVQNLKGQLISEVDLTFNGQPAREFSISGAVEGSPLFYHSRVFVVDNRLYELRIVRVGEAPVDLADAVRFFSSFRAPSTGKAPGM
ncbi:MAG: hypothetical protein R3B90_21100 [Planctomycetaceae bacterium]